MCLCGLEMGESDSCNLKRVKIGKKIYKRVDNSFDDNERCHDCGILNKKGNIHHVFCDMEKCPKCGKQLISCLTFNSCNAEEFMEFMK